MRIDRATTGAADRRLHLRVRSPSALTLTGEVARGKYGSSLLSVRKVYSSSGAPEVRSLPQVSECPPSSRTCDVSKLPAASEYRIAVAGPSAVAIHVLDALPAEAEAPAGERSWLPRPERPVSRPAPSCCAWARIAASARSRKRRSVFGLLGLVFFGQWRRRNSRRRAS